MNLLIGGIQYKIDFVDDLRDETGKRVNGTLKTDQSTIDVATDVSKQKQYSILVHEAMHGIQLHYDVDGDEHIVTKIAGGMYAFIVNNASFIKELIKHDEKLRKQGSSI